MGVSMNVAIAVIVGAVLGLAGTVGGVAVHTAGSDGAELKLYSYSDK